jgi:Ca2+-binding RTX toxin-like protein
MTGFADIYNKAELDKFKAAAGNYYRKELKNIQHQPSKYDVEVFSSSIAIDNPFALGPSALVTDKETGTQYYISQNAFEHAYTSAVLASKFTPYAATLAGYYKENWESGLINGADKNPNFVYDKSSADFLKVDTNKDLINNSIGARAGGMFFLQNIPDDQIAEVIFGKFFSENPNDRLYTPQKTDSTYYQRDYNPLTDPNNPFSVPDLGYISAVGPMAWIGSSVTSLIMSNFASALAGIPSLIDPLILDLDGNGITTTPVSGGGAFFDLDANGFAEQTSWVGNNDGILFRDLNHDGTLTDGSELFGDHTLSNGRVVTDGFGALAALDENHDDKIDINDSAFSELRVLKGDGTTYTLEQLNIKSLNIENSQNFWMDSDGVMHETDRTDTETIADWTDASGNLMQSLGTYTKTDDTTAEMISYLLNRNPISSIAPEQITNISDEIAALPFVSGMGNVFDLYTAMAKDETGQMQHLVESFVGESDATIRTTLVETLLKQWAGTTDVSPTSRGTHINGQNLATLEKFMGQKFPTAEPSEIQAQSLDLAYYYVREYVYAQLNTQTHLSELMSFVKLTTDPATGNTLYDFTGVTSYLDNLLANPGTASQGEALLGDFGRVVRGLNIEESSNYHTAVSEHFIHENPDHAWILNTSGKNSVNDSSTYTYTAGTYYVAGSDIPDVIVGTADKDYISGYAGCDAIRGLGGNDIIHGYEGNDYLEGNDGNDTIVGGHGNDTILGGSGNDFLQDGGGSESEALSRNYFDGGSGNDQIYAGDQEDTIIGGTGDDTIYGYGGDDLYIINLGDGNDTIKDDNAAPNQGNDTIQFAAGIDKAQVNFSGSGEDLIITIDTDGPTGVNAPQNVIKIIGGLQVNDVNPYIPAATLHIENYEFLSDGTVFSFNDIIANLQSLGTNGSDGLVGANFFANTIYGYDGGDVLTGGYVSDTMYGGAGNDYFYGSSGDDYLDGGSGNDRLDGAADNDTYIFEAGFGVDTIEDTVGDNTLDISAFGANQAVDLSTATSYTNGSNSVSWATGAIKGITTGSGDDTLTGDSNANTLTGGSGDDSLAGGSGNDTYKFASGFGLDTISDSSGSNTLDLSPFTSNLSADISGTTYTESTGNTVTWTSGDISNLTTGSGNDTLTGSTAGNTLAGGQGNDTYVFSGSFGQDNITEATSNGGVDTVDLSTSTTALTVNLASSSGDEVSDGTNTVNWSNSTVENAITGSGNDTITGSAGDNVINAGSGDDSVSGGQGNDTYVFSGSFGDDTVVEASNEGNDTVDLSAISAALTVNLTSGAGDEVSDSTNTVNWSGSSVENIIAGSGNDSITGSASANQLTGNAGDDTLAGGSGDDTYVFAAGFGDDTLIENSGEGTDTIDLSAMTAALTVNLTPGSGDEVSDGSNTINWSGDYVENIIAGSGNDIITGNASANMLTGNGGNDTLIAGDGADTLIGGLGDDDLQGGSGNDAYLGLSTTSGADVITDTAGTADSVTINANSYTALWSAVDSDSDGHVDQLVIDFGGGHSVTINDYFSGTAETVEESTAGSGAIESLLFNDQTLNFAAVQSLLTGNNRYTGSSGNDLIQTLEGDDYLNGLAGNDTLIAHDGDDTLVGGSGNDSLNGGNGQNTYAFDNGWGVDTIADSAGTGLVDFRNATGNLTIDLNAGSISQGSNAVSWSGSIIDHAVGGYNNDTITGTSEANYLDGQSGDDSIAAAGGDDTLVGGTGNDTLDGGSGENSYVFESNWGQDSISGDSGTGTVDLSGVAANLSIQLTSGSGAEVTDGVNSIQWSSDIVENAVAGSGNDTLSGSSGDNILEGGAGDDSLSGGSGNDTYVFNLGFGKDTIIDASGSNTLSLEGLVDDIALNLSTDTTYSVDADNTITWGSGNIANLITGFGDDTLSGSSGNNTLAGSLGDDIYVFSGSFGQDTVVENTDAGNETVDLSAITASLTVNLASGSGDEVSDGTNTVNWSGSSVENIIAGSGNDSITGSAIANQITGNAGDDTLAGGSGDDTYVFAAGFGDDTLTENSGEGTDTIDLSAMTAALTVNLTSGAGDEVSDGINTINWSGDDVENVIAGSGNDTITGSAGNNQITGGAGDDSLAGGSGDDVYLFSGNFGTDTINDASGQNTLDFSRFDSTKAVSINLASGTTFTQGGNTVNWTLGDIQHIVSGAGDDNLTGSSGANQLVSGSGNDTLTGSLF